MHSASTIESRQWQQIDFPLLGVPGFTSSSHARLASCEACAVKTRCRSLIGPRFQPRKRNSCGQGTPRRDLIDRAKPGHLMQSFKAYFIAVALNV